MKKAVLFALIVGAGMTHAVAQDKAATLRIALWVPQTHPLVASTQAWAASIEKASGGTIKTSVFPSQQLGSAREYYNMVRDGIADVAHINPATEPDRFPVLNAAQLPFTFADGRKGTLAVDEWYRKYATSEMKDTKLCFAFIQAPGSLHGTKKIVGPENLRGAKIRTVPGMPAEVVNALGGAGVQLPAAEVYFAVERGIVDGIMLPWGSLTQFGIDKFVKHHLDAPLYTTPFTYNMNAAKYASMSAAQKKVIDDHCTPEWAAKITAAWHDSEDAARDKIRTLPGHDAQRLAPDQLAQWKAALAPSREIWANAVAKSGGNPAAVQADLQAALQKHGAAVGETAVLPLIAAKPSEKPPAPAPQVAIAPSPPPSPPPAAVRPVPALPPVAALPAPAAVAPAEKRVALVIGNSSYKSVAKLANPQRDAAAVASALRATGFQSVSLQTDLGRDRLQQVLREFARTAEAADWAVVYYAGHGMEVGGVNYLIPVDASIATDRDIGLEAVPLEQVLNAAERASKLRLFILDACRDNPFASQMRRTLSAASRSVARGLASVEPEAGTMVVYAAKHGETALDGDAANSPFAAAFIKNLREPGLEVRFLFDTVRDDVMQATGRKQQPFSYGSISARQRFYFVAEK